MRRSGTRDRDRVVGLEARADDGDGVTVEQVGVRGDGDARGRGQRDGAVEGDRRGGAVADLLHARQQDARTRGGAVGGGAVDPQHPSHGVVERDVPGRVGHRVLPGARAAVERVGGRRVEALEQGDHRVRRVVRAGDRDGLAVEQVRRRGHREGGRRGRRDAGVELDRVVVGDRLLGHRAGADLAGVHAGAVDRGAGHDEDAAGGERRREGAGRVGVRVAQRRLVAVGDARRRAPCTG